MRLFFCIDWEKPVSLTGVWERGEGGRKEGMGREKWDGERITGERGMSRKNRRAKREPPQDSSLA